MVVPDRIDARGLCEAFRVAEHWLELNREPVNAINVYPVPDGDTGTNMLLTLRASLDAAEPDDGASVGDFALSMARGALLGARGNSGVILSQMIRGLADALAPLDQMDGRALSIALGSAARAAYDAVGDPVEGTMLTVMREAADAAASVPQTAGGPSIAGVLDAAAREAAASVERTPALLPRLAEAGVVDAGGLGVALVLDGLRHGSLGMELPEPMAVPAGNVEMSAVEHQGHGYCTEFVVIAAPGAGLEREAVHQALLAAGGESLLVVGDASALHVHVHVADPGPVLSAGAAAGALVSVKVDNMQAQHESWVAGHKAGPAATLPSLGLVAVAQGEGIAAAFRELGAGSIVDGGPTANPSAGELLEAARRAGRDHVFLLPNDANIVLAAEQAASQEPGFITVIPARSVAAGLSAAVGYEPAGDAADVGRQMAAATEGVHAVEVTRAVRDTTSDGVTVARGDAIVIVDGRLVARAGTLLEAMLAGLGGVAEGAELVTVYLGADAGPGDGEAAQRLIEEACPGVEVEVVQGGQPHYPYILGVE